jgi:DNA-binding NarL/FixJ family response regulator
MIGILLVDDQKLIRQGLKALLELDPDIQVLGSASDGQTAIEQAEILHPDIVLLDIRMPGMDGVMATRIICERFANTKVIVLSGYDDEEYLTDALRSGAKGYLLKDTPAEELIGVIRSVHKGYSQIGPGLLEKITAKIPALPSTDSPFARPELTALKQLERQVELQLTKFDAKALLEVVSLAVEQKALADLLTYVDNQLRGNLNNLAALYLAGALWAQSSQKNHMLALYYLNLGFQEGIQQGLSREDLLLFYRAGVRLKPVEAFSWLTHVNAPWNNEAGLSFLLREASHLFGITSEQYRSLRALRQIRSMRALSNRCVALNRRVEFLHQGFKQFANL